MREFGRIDIMINNVGIGGGGDAPAHRLSEEALELILDVRSRGMPIVLISHNMPHVFEVADRIPVHCLGKRLCVINPKDYTMSDAVAFMTGARPAPDTELAA